MLANEDRRAFARLPIDCTVVFKTTNKKAVTYGSGKNLSGNGILFESPEPVAIGSELEIDVVPTLEQFKPLNATAQVVRVEPVSQESSYLVAATLTHILS